MEINRRFKDTLFRKVFNNKKDLLSLYNALKDGRSDKLVKLTDKKEPEYFDDNDFFECDNEIEIIEVKKEEAEVEEAPAKEETPKKKKAPAKKTKKA